jgi:hypothetical protein
MDAVFDPRRAARLAREGRSAAARAQDAAMDQVKTAVRAAIRRLTMGRRLPPGGPWDTAQAIRRSLAETPGILVCEARRLDRDGDRVQVLMAGLQTEDIDLGRGDEPWLSLSCDRLLIDRRRIIHLNLHGHLLVHAHAQKRFAQRQEDAGYAAFCNALLTALPACALVSLAWPTEGDVMIPAPGGAFLGQRLTRPYGPHHEILAYQVQGPSSKEIDPPPSPLDRPGGRVRLELRTFVPSASLSLIQDAVVEASTRAVARTPERADATVALAWTLLLGDATGTPNPDEIAAASAEIADVAVGTAWSECVRHRRRTPAAQASPRRTYGAHPPRTSDAAVRTDDGT